MLAQWALVVHVLGWVFWLGTDIGVFIACRHAERGDLSVETRLTLLEVGMLLDRLPRLAVPLVWGSGAILSEQWGYEFVPLPCALIVTALWLIVTGIIIVQPPGARSRAVALFAQTIIYAGVIVGMGGGATLLLASGDIPLWLALKGYAYAIIGVAALVLEKYFIPVVAGFQRLASEGGSECLNNKITRKLKPVYTAVLCIYGGTLLAGVSGLLKPSL